MESFPSFYKGRRYRSRLEIKWAIFFDYLGWQYEYEPFDFRGWIPDFAIFGKETILVEVKPITQFDEDVVEKITKASGSEFEILLVGLRPFQENGYGYLVPMVGWLGHKDWGEGCKLEWGLAPFGIWEGSESGQKNEEKVMGFCSVDGSFHDRITGGYDGGHYGNGQLLWNEIELLWNQAVNKAQWVRKEDDY